MELVYTMSEAYGDQDRVCFAFYLPPFVDMAGVEKSL